MVYFYLFAVSPIIIIPRSIGYHGFIEIEDVYGSEYAGNYLEDHDKGEDGGGEFLTFWFVHPECDTSPAHSQEGNHSDVCGRITKRTVLP